MASETKNTFTCDACKGTFEKAWTEEEAKQELKDHFGDSSDNAEVCDDCYNKIMVNIAASN